MKRLVLLFSLFSASSHAASFNCELASTQTEKMICANNSLSTMDEVIHTLYVNALKEPQNTTLRSEQRAWLKQRNQSCSQLADCEQFFIDRINVLLDKMIKKDPTDLTQGMTLPDKSALDEYSAKALEKIDDEVYKPWLRKELLSSDTDAFEPIAAVVNEQVFIYYKNSPKNNEKTVIHEYNPLTKQSHVVDSGVTYEMYIKGNELFYYKWVDRHKTKLQEMAYDIGSQSASAPARTLAKEDYNIPFINQSSREYSRWALSNDGTKLALVTSQLAYKKLGANVTGKEGEYLRRMTELITDKSLAESQTIAIYDSITDSINIMPDVMTNTESRKWWSIYDLTWSPDDKSLYFDNEGERLACIWEYTNNADIVQKIVPEHTAISPYPFRYQDRDYIVYIHAGGGVNDGALMLAVRP
ncbi:lysozyme inhibitor LprI family protein [Vibrio sp. Of7-15]|uniref:lysozyme inhibitor LprI family protein n=1 Tax=Vibrio sp. Of7-15 TaxID=2724879 RepID=UPI001EF2FCEA|nr:lysozyme inhibitor LprI family protein [Vibrio sp. Of7-15]MCG7496564.1 lysozyme inhibitor LprI family protein [Vibrio sp. Of7-15]